MSRQSSLIPQDALLYLHTRTSDLAQTVMRRLKRCLEMFGECLQMFPEVPEQSLSKEMLLYFESQTEWKVKIRIETYTAAWC